ncbi:MAG TPA: 16S rRNA (cytidine(1402)-2'-O)-methyltransferase [Bryobacteraceae bacterium]|jgi:16S rRNA (cytidine1402-2'-O)-methyltransferase
MLYVVATPIGNLEDMTHRATRVLAEVDLIACEDTRQTRKLLDHYGIKTAVTSYHEHNETARAAELAERMLAGTNIALVTDAGTPLISDPGFRLVRAALDAGVTVVPIPGVSAVVTALSGAGLGTDQFHFGGFLPAKQGQRRAAIAALKHEASTVIFYEAPHRILEALADIEAELGPSRPVVVARELTKLHEEFVRGSAREVRAVMEAKPVVRGEITLLIGKSDAAPEADDPRPVSEAVAELERDGMPRMDAVKYVARARGLAKRDVYKEVFGGRA